MERGGCVYLRPFEPDRGEPAEGWSGHWEKDVPADESAPVAVSWKGALERGWVEEGQWATVEEAIAWGRERSEYVLVYLDPGDVESIYSAGDIHYTELGGPYLDENGEPVRGHIWPTWPPPPEVWPGNRT
jgi:hypothetical protein